MNTQLSRPRRTDRRSDRGFTILELAVVLMIGAVLTSITLNAFSDVQLRFAQRGAQRTFQSMFARARAMAVESGTRVEFHADGPGDSIWIERNDSIIDRVRIEEEFGVDLGVSAGGNRFRMCFDSRGLVRASCSSLTSGIGVVDFEGNGAGSGERRVLFILPGGALVEEFGTG